MATILWVLVALMLILWVVFFSLNLAAGFIHLLLVVAVIVAGINLLISEKVA